MYNQGYDRYSGRGYQPLKERSGCLWILLIFGTLGSVTSLFQGCGLPSAEELDAMQAFLGDIPEWYWYATGFFNFLNLVSLAGLWMWRRWGWYGMAGINVLMVILALVGGLPVILVISTIIGSAVSLAIWWVVLSGHWDNFE